MTIEFNCPSCGQLIAFPDKHAGKRAKCLGCQQRLIIPEQSFQKPKKVIEPKVITEPTPGFYRAAWVDSWRLFVHSENATSLVFVTAVVCFRFFLAKACCLNVLSSIIIWGWLLAFYLNIIAATALDEDSLPEIYLGTSVSWLWHTIWPFLVFFYTLFIVGLPFLLTLSAAAKHGIGFTDVWHGSTTMHRTLQALQVAGLFLFPVAILTTAVGRDITLLRPDYLIIPVCRAFAPYMVPVTLLVAGVLLESCTRQYQGPDVGAWRTGFDLGLNLLVQVIAILAMRSIGLFYRHYECYFRW